MIIFTIGTYGVNSLILGWCGSTCGQTPEKKAVSIGIVTTVMNASFIWYVTSPIQLHSLFQDALLTPPKGHPICGLSRTVLATSLPCHRRPHSPSPRSCSRGSSRSSSCAATKRCVRAATRRRPSLSTRLRRTPGAGDATCIHNTWL